MDNLIKKNKKHGPDQSVDKQIVNKLKLLCSNNRINCINAHKASDELDRTPSEIGIQLDLLNIKIIRCQLGLFGHSNKKQVGNRKTEDQTGICLDKYLKDNKITCLECWVAAEEQGVVKTIIGRTCNQQKIKIVQCQLGAF